MLRTGRGRRLRLSVLHWNDSFLDAAIWWKEEEHGTILRASAHMEAITSNCALRLHSQSEWNHRNPHPSLSSASALLLLARACSGAPSSCLRTPHLNHYFFLCSSAQPMIRGSQGLISSFKTEKRGKKIIELLWCSISARLWLSNTFVCHSRINYHTWSV